MKQAVRYSTEQGTISPDYLARYVIVYDSPKYVSPRDYGTNLSRYSPYRQIVDQESFLRYHESFNSVKIVESPEDVYYTVTHETVDRLDIVSYKYYGVPMYWWVLGIANDIINPFDLPLGTVLRIPPLSSLYISKGVTKNV